MKIKPGQLGRALDQLITKDLNGPPLANFQTQEPPDVAVPADLEPAQGSIAELRRGGAVVRAELAKASARSMSSGAARAGATAR